MSTRIAERKFKIVPVRQYKVPQISWRQVVFVLSVILAVGFLTVIGSLVRWVMTPNAPLIRPIRVVSTGVEIRGADQLWTCHVQVIDVNGFMEAWSGIRYCSLKQGDVIE